MTRTMFDSVRPAEIPADAEMVGLYVDGKYAATPADWNRFPRAVKVRISAVGDNLNAHVFDLEPGCIWPPADVVDCVLGARALGIDPTVYVNERNHWAPAKAAFDARGIAHPHWWVANYDNVRTVPTGAVAKQYADPGMPGVSGHFDLSVVADFWPGVDGSFDNPEKDEGDDVPNISQADLDELLTAARKITHEYKVTDGTPARPFGPDVADDLPGQVMSIRARQEQQVGQVRSIGTSVANIETVVNQLLNDPDAGDQVTLTDAQAQAGFESLGAQLAAQTSEALEGLYQRLVDTNSVDAVREVLGEYVGQATVGLSFRKDRAPETGQ